MTDFGFPKKKKRTIDDLNVVPILDMFVSIVFFLLLSASMVGMTKIVLPPSSTSSVESGVTKVPLNPKLYVLADRDPNKIKVLLRWEGDTPGNDSLTLDGQIIKDQKKPVEEIKQLVKKFKEKFPEEKTVQISLQSGVIYQWLISAMDGVRDQLPDMVLNSYDSANAIKE